MFSKGCYSIKGDNSAKKIYAIDVFSIGILIYEISEPQHVIIESTERHTGGQMHTQPDTYMCPISLKLFAYKLLVLKKKKNVLRQGASEFEGEKTFYAYANNKGTKHPLE